MFVFLRYHRSCKLGILLLLQLIIIIISGITVVSIIIFIQYYLGTRVLILYYIMHDRYTWISTIIHRIRIDIATSALGYYYRFSNTRVLCTRVLEYSCTRYPGTRVLEVPLSIKVLEYSSTPILEYSRALLWYYRYLYQYRIYFTGFLANLLGSYIRI